jgi:hypothetical protein
MKFFLAVAVLTTLTFVVPHESFAQAKKKTQTPSVKSRYPWYPERIAYSPMALAQFRQDIAAFKVAYPDAHYDTEVLDTVACSIQLFSRANPGIQLQLGVPQSPKERDVEVLKALRKFIDTWSNIFRTTSREIVLQTITDYGDVIGVVFERGYYINRTAAGQSRGGLEFIVSKKGEVGLIATTVTRFASRPVPDSAIVTKVQAIQKVMGKQIDFIIDKQPVRFNVDKIDMVETNGLCVYEKKIYNDQYSPTGRLTSRMLQSSEPRLAWEIFIMGEKREKWWSVYIDAITGEELATDKNLKTE